MRLKLYFLLILIGTIVPISRNGKVFAENPPWSVPDTVEGVWKVLNYHSNQPETIVKLFVKNDTLFGEIIDVIDRKLKNNPRCEQCTDTLKNVPLADLTILWGCIKKGRYWKRGKYLDIADGKVYRCEVELNEKGDLDVFIYVNRIFKLGRTLRWVRVE